MSWKIYWYHIAPILCLTVKHGGEHAEFDKHLSELPEDLIDRICAGKTGRLLLDLSYVYAPIDASLRDRNQDASFDALSIRIVKFNAGYSNTSAPEEDVQIDGTTLYFPADLFPAEVADRAESIDHPPGALRIHPFMDAATDVIECMEQQTPPPEGYLKAIQDQAHAKGHATAGSLGTHRFATVADMWIGDTHLTPDEVTSGDEKVGTAKITLGQQKKDPTQKDPVVILSPDWPCGALTGTPRCG